MTPLILTLAASFLFGLSHAAEAQSAEVFAKYKWTLPDRPFNCEMNLQHLEDLKVLFNKQANRSGILLMLARLGTGEKRRALNRRRLDNVRRALTYNLGINGRQIVVGEGDRVQGYGRVEFYLAGELVGALPVYRNDSAIKCAF